MTTLSIGSATATPATVDTTSGNSTDSDASSNFAAVLQSSSDLDEHRYSALRRSAAEPDPTPTNAPADSAAEQNPDLPSGSLTQSGGIRVNAGSKARSKVAADATDGTVQALAVLSQGPQPGAPAVPAGVVVNLPADPPSAASRSTGESHGTAKESEPDDRTSAVSSATAAAFSVIAAVAQVATLQPGAPQAAAAESGDLPSGALQKDSQFPGYPSGAGRSIGRQPNASLGNAGQGSVGSRGAKLVGVGTTTGPTVSAVPAGSSSPGAAESGVPANISTAAYPPAAGAPESGTSTVAGGFSLVETAQSTLAAGTGRQQGSDTGVSLTGGSATGGSVASTSTPIAGSSISAAVASAGIAGAGVAGGGIAGSSLPSAQITSLLQASGTVVAGIQGSSTASGRASRREDSSADTTSTGPLIAIPTDVSVTATSSADTDPLGMSASYQGATPQPTPSAADQKSVELSSQAALVQAANGGPQMAAAPTGTTQTATPQTGTAQVATAQTGSAQTTTAQRRVEDTTTDQNTATDAYQLVANPVTVAVTTPVPASAPAPNAPLYQQLAEPVLKLRAAGDGTHRIVIDLHPRDLGPVSVEVRLRNGEITVALASGNEATRATIAAALPQLSQQLKDAGMSGFTLGVDSGSVGNPGSGAAGGQSSAQQRTAWMPSLPATTAGSVTSDLGPARVRGGTTSTNGMDRWL